MKKVPLYKLLLIIGTAYADDNKTADPGSDISSNSPVFEESDSKETSTREVVDRDDRKTYRFNGLDLLKRGNSNDSPKLSSLDRLSQIMENQLAVGQFISADLVSENVGGKALRGADASPKVLAGKDDQSVDLSFQIELRYDKECFYVLVVPNLVSVLEEAAVRKLADSVSVTVIDKRSDHKQRMPVTHSRSFPANRDLFLTRTFGNLKLGDWKFQVPLQQDSIYVACNLGRDTRGNHQRFSIYELDRKTYDPLFITLFLHGWTRA
jgi:hypothetical protein